MKQFFERNKKLIYLLLVFIITIPSFISLTKTGYFTMHDNQHIARLFVLDNGISQGILFPRWVDELGFGYGYPLFNFYPPLIYYVAEFFHLVGFSFVWSIKLTFITGYIFAAFGMYLFIKSLYDRITGVVAATLYTYFFYHAVNAYVRGALAEFFSMSVLPYLFHSMYCVYKKPSIKSGLYFGLMIAAIILTHPLIAFPSMIYLGIFFLFYFVTSKKKSQIDYVKTILISGLWGLSISSFFWLPSMLERKFTKVNDILLTELADYSIHFIYPQQFLYSLWSYGGSLEGPADGFTFQLGKVHMLLVGTTIISLVLLWFWKRKQIDQVTQSIFFLGLLTFSIFMTLEISKPVWQLVGFLSYLQFPWRFLTFTAIFISLIGSLTVYYSKFIVPQTIRVVGALCIIIGTIVIYQKYFVPQQYIQATDAQLTSTEEISWNISKTSFEFVPKDVITKRSALNTTILDINKDQIATSPFVILQGNAQVSTQSETYEKKIFSVKATSPFTFRLNTYNFPNWTAYKVENGERKELSISADNDYVLITLPNLPAGEYNLEFIFKDTTARTVTEIISGLSIVGAIIVVYLKRKELVSNT